MKIKAVLLDFDGTLVTGDLLTEVCGIVGKKEDAERINREVHAGEWKGIEGLKARINFLKGVTMDQIDEKMSGLNCLMPGAKDFINWLSEQGIKSFIISGNLLPVLKYFQKELGVTEVFGIILAMDGNKIIGIDEEESLGRDFKMKNVDTIIKKYSFKMDEVVAIGDAPVDQSMFEKAGLTFGMRARPGVMEMVDYMVDDFWQVMEIMINL